MTECGHWTAVNEHELCYINCDGFNQTNNVTRHMKDEVENRRTVINIRLNDRNWEV